MRSGLVRPVAILAMVATLLLGGAPAEAAQVKGPQPFGLAPVPAASGQPRSYFQLQLRPGASITDTVTIANLGTAAAALRVSASSGVTSPNSGSAFQGYFAPCQGVACWVQGLPAAVSLTPRERRQIRFTVRVPAGTPFRQYLAGITAQPAAPPAPVQVGGNGRSSARALIIDQISVGVAITVGPLAGMRSGLDIPNVTGGAVGATPRLYVQVRNTGQTFTRSRGTAVCKAGGQDVTTPVTMDTVLPADGATLAVNAPGLAGAGRTTCVVRLLYGAQQEAVWAGPVTIAAVNRTPEVETGPGAFSSLPAKAGFPVWAIILIVLASLVLAGLALVSFLLVRRHRDSAAPNGPPAD